MPQEAYLGIFFTKTKVYCIFFANFSLFSFIIIVKGERRKYENRI